MAFRCASCYHLFGVDLIADAQRQLHVIEVNIAPDLTLSTEGACAATERGCVGGSSIYDHTKRAAAYSSVRPRTAAHRRGRVGATVGAVRGEREGSGEGRARARGGVGQGRRRDCGGDGEGGSWYLYP